MNYSFDKKERIKWLIWTVAQIADALEKYDVKIKESPGNALGGAGQMEVKTHAIVVLNILKQMGYKVIAMTKEHNLRLYWTLERE